MEKRTGPRRRAIIPLRPEPEPPLAGRVGAAELPARVIVAEGHFSAPIVTIEALQAHLLALAALEPRFAVISGLAGAVPMRHIDPGFKGLCWIVTGQQISTTAARAIFASCEAALGALTAESIAAVDDAVLKSAGQSAPKIRTLRAISAAVLAGDIVLDDLAEMEAEAAIARLVAIKGIGRWTAEVYLLFALGHPDVFPAGDLALRESARIAFGFEERPAEKALARQAEGWRPHRAAAARLLWAYYSAMKRGDATPA